jgi:hypothetical protein
VLNLLATRVRLCGYLLRAGEVHGGA